MKRITRTELVWKGKYDENGEIRKVDRTILPFQVVRRVNECKPGDPLTHAGGDKWQYMLIWGDNKEARNGRKETDLGS